MEYYVSLNLVKTYRSKRGRDCQVNHARASNANLDDWARHHRFDRRWRCDAHFFPAERRRLISPSGPHLFHPRIPSHLVCLLQAENSPSTTLIEHEKLPTTGNASDF